MPKSTPINIWVCNRADDWTTFGVYYKAKRRVFARARTKHDFETLIERGEFTPDVDRPVVFCGDPLPADWRPLLPSYITCER